MRDELDDDNFSLPRIYRAIGRAEAQFNRELRTPQMETDLLFTVTAEATDLPVDFLQLRAIYIEGSPDTTLRSMSPDGLRSLYSGASGCPSAYAIENRRILIGPVGEAYLQMTYYARIPSLTESNPSNWLLDENPDVYLHAVLAILFNKLGDAEKAVINQTLADTIMEQISRSARKARWGAAPLVPMGIRQVWGARI